MKEIQAKTLLRKFKRIDSWFISRYAMNLYRGCLHNCVYCDGRTEKYQVSGNFGSDIGVKINALELLEKELNPYRRRQPLIPGFVMLGGGVGDSYQPIEDSYHLAQRTLRILQKYQWPVHILTKSTRVLKDISIINKINEQKKAIVSFSFSSTDDMISKIFEPGVPSPSERLETITQLTNRGIPCGMFLMPPIPFITDTTHYLEQSIADAKKAGALFVIFGGMTLKEGKQKQYFIDILKQHFPQLMTEYNHIYKSNPWGQAIPQYYQTLQHAIYGLAKKYKMPLRIPVQLFSEILPENDRVVVILDHIHYYLQLHGHRSPYGYAASQLSKIRTPFSQIINELRSVSGVGPTTERIINEILTSGTSSYYQKLLTYS